MPAVPILNVGPPIRAIPSFGRLHDSPAEEDGFEPSVPPKKDPPRRDVRSFSTSLPRGTEGSNPSSSSGESIANLFELEDVVEDGCWFNALCTRLKPSHAIELTVVSLDRNVAATVALT